MRFDDIIIAKTDRFSIGQDNETGGHYISFPVSNGLVEYEEYYVLDENMFSTVMQAVEKVGKFVEECRAREHDDLLIVKPGRIRGEPV